MWGRGRVGVERSFHDREAIFKRRRTSSARRDRSIVPINRTRGRAMRLAPTDAERKLWWHLRYRLALPNTHFRRQVHLGRYIVDFACHALKIVIEIDGASTPEQSKRDARRTQLRSRNAPVLVCHRANRQSYNDYKRARHCIAGEATTINKTLIEVLGGSICAAHVYARKITPGLSAHWGGRKPASHCKTATRR